MTQYIDKSALVAEIEKRKANIKDYCVREGHDRRFDVVPEQLAQILSFLDTLEVKDANEALRTEYEKGRADVIEKTLEWLWDLNQEHEIMSYTDSHVLSSEELQQYYKNIIEQ